MSRQSGRNAASQAATGTNRQNEYFVPRDGIDREVITADICRYLGNDALVRPGTYDNPQTNTLVQGYFITAYRNLTTAMIEDLKADSAKWDQERRAHARNGVQTYRYSETHSARQQQGPTSDAPHYADASYRDYDQQPRYPGTGAPGYNGASAGGYGQPQGGPYGSGMQSGGYGQGYGGAAAPQYAAQPDPRYSTGSPLGGGYSQPGVYATGADRPIAPGTDPRYPADPYGQAAAAAAARLPSSVAAQQAGIYSTAPAQGQASYPPTTQAPAGYNYAQVQVPTAASQAYAQQPADPFFGRAGTAAPQGYGSAQQAQQYGASTSSSRTPATSSSSAQMMASSGQSTARRSERESDRHADRHSSDRRHRPNHRS